MVHQPSCKRMPDFVELGHAARLYANAGRILLALAGIVLIALPFTQHIWTWDRFLRGGHDFETTVLLIVTTMCLILLLMKICSECLTPALSAIWVSRPGLPLATPASQSIFPHTLMPGVHPTHCSVCLQI